MTGLPRVRIERFHSTQPDAEHQSWATHGPDDTMTDG